MIVVVLEPEGVWRCNECDEFVDNPRKHARDVHDAENDVFLVHEDDT